MEHIMNNYLRCIVAIFALIAFLLLTTLISKYFSGVTYESYYERNLPELQHFFYNYSQTDEHQYVCPFVPIHLQNVGITDIILIEDVLFFKIKPGTLDDYPNGDAYYAFNLNTEPRHCEMMADRLLKHSNYTSMALPHSLSKFILLNQN